MELLIVQLLIVAFLIAYMMGEEVKVNKYPTILITREVDATPSFVWDAYFRESVRKWDEDRKWRESLYWKEDIADGLTWAAEQDI